MINTALTKAFFNRTLQRLSAATAAFAMALCALGASAETITFIHNDPWGNPVMATDQAGNVVWKENYQPYGAKHTNSPDSNKDHIGFSGKPYDPDTGLVYMGARYYNPMLGRFMGIDPAEPDLMNIHSLNRYSYANNNPYRYVDPDGRAAVLVWGAAALGVGGLIYSTQPPEQKQAMARSLQRAWEHVFTSSGADGSTGSPDGNSAGSSAGDSGTGSAKDRESTLRPGPHAGKSIPARGPGRDFSKEERDKINEIGQSTGCHTCGSKNPGTPSGNHVPDHQPPNALNPSGGAQDLYPHCLACSRVQGGQVRGAQHRPDKGTN